MKTCKRCACEKPPTSFNESPRHKDRLFPWCKECKAAYQRAWWANNQHKHREYDAGSRAEWRKANPERQHAIVARQNANKRGKLKDDYIAFLLRKKGIEYASPDAIAAMREIVLVKRLIKEIEENENAI